MGKFPLSTTSSVGTTGSAHERERERERGTTIPVLLQKLPLICGRVLPVLLISLLVVQ